MTLSFLGLGDFEEKLPLTKMKNTETGEEFGGRYQELNVFWVHMGLSPNSG